MNRHLIYYIAAALLLASCTDHRERAMDHYAQALRLLDSGDAPEALRQLEQADQLTDDDSIQALVHSQMGSLYLEQGMLTEAGDNYRQALHHDSARRLESFCRMSTHERRVCQLLKLGVPPSAIADLTARTRQAVSNTRKRLYEKAFGRKGSSDEWDAFIDSL